MSYNAENIINIVTRISPAGLAFANFGKAFLFAPETEAPAGFDPDTIRVYQSLNDLSVDFASTTETYKAANSWFGTIPNPREITVYILDSTDANIVDSLNKARNVYWWYWTFFTKDVYADLVNFPAIASWGDSNTSFVPNCAAAAASVDIRNPALNTDIASVLTAAGTRHCYTLSNAESDYAGISLAAVFAAVNYSGEKTTITGEFKKINATAEELTGTEYSAMRQPSKKASFYTVVDLQGSEDSGRMINTYSHSSFGEYIDDIVNLDAFVNDLRVTLYNALTNTPTKLAQTPSGQQVLISAAKETCERYISNNYLGARTYIDNDDGLEKTTRGYEILTKPEDILTLSSSDRAQRKSAPIRIKVFKAGAIHSVDVTVEVF
jgi:hypothetical protein